MRKLKSIRELRSMPNIPREGYFASLTQAERNVLIKRFAESSITLGLTQHDNNVSLHMLSNPNKDLIGWTPEGQMNAGS
ncbi:hypothetical protein Fullmetal_11 [Microbacterium phage Fullmetal]|uniref:Uncharacterized protein n=6 Tax=Akonivirus TaxID=2842540 RepID=A0A6M3T3L2_9CAUD|nr:hypothetical protein HWD33_gp11 [Microbacterium phage Phedro]QFG04934.1 hypothetical protein SEA_PHRIEDRICE_11 [Microbacterium phage PhriedRice]QJD52863.1 hypothetical protein SEA_PHRACTURED_11 [Microbacterium phage Phractured]QJD52973.1 hypothetical protein SEA_PHARKY_11 [Microbacterium phage Pharky]QWY82703.1 hypothetical protein SEA_STAGEPHRIGHT_11 [Microbacterium phage StagePhright]UXE04100.1 hypothetical protein Fullmetal_11 [Microbacterium phage Fullmetal]